MFFIFNHAVNKLLIPLYIHFHIFNLAAGPYLFIGKKIEPYRRTLFLDVVSVELAVWSPINHTYYNDIVSFTICPVAIIAAALLLKMNTYVDDIDGTFG